MKQAEWQGFYTVRLAEFKRRAAQEKRKRIYISTLHIDREKL